jgi:hypothetical protein
MIEQARQFTFGFYDVNSDAAVDFNDLFTLLREIGSEQALINAAYRDINDLQNWLKQSQDQIRLNDPVISHTPEGSKVKNLETYLNSQHQLA